MEYPNAILEILSGIFLGIIAFYYRKSLKKYSFSLLVYSVATIFYELYGNYLGATRQNNHIEILVFSILETVLFSIYYYFEMPKHKFLVYFISIIIIVFFIINIFEETQLLNDFSSTIQSIGFILLSMWVFYLTLANPKSNSLLKEPLFWINSGVFIYFSGKFFVFLFITNVLNENDKSLTDFWYIITVLIVIFRIMLSIGICLTPQKFNFITKK